MKKVIDVFLGGILSFIDYWVFHLLFFLFALVLPFMVRLCRVLSSMCPLRNRVWGVKCVRSCLLFSFHLIYY
jgi:uncharacterized membrane protein YccF (DUF307 family)